MSELFMECIEEELEPWQRQTPEVHLIEDDDDEPIFVGVLSSTKKDPGKSNPPAPPQKSKKREVTQPAPPPAPGPTPIILPLTITGNAVNAAPATLTTVTPQPVIVNNQGFIVTSSQLANNRDFIASLGAQYPPGTSFTIVPAGQQQLFQQVTTGRVMPGVVHRPQVQQISNNVVTLSNVQSPAVYSAQPGQMQVTQPKMAALQSIPVPIKINCINRDQSSAKRVLTQQESDSPAKKIKLDLYPPKIVLKLENGVIKKKCPRCQEEFHSNETLKCHMMKSCESASSSSAVSTDKRIMLVPDFYYGRFEGDVCKRETQKTNYTFKCQSCLKILKNNVRFMNHMKHHLELEKQNSESWESHTTCQHCYRQYMTPFQLQCHIESAHSPIESSTNCKICELAFESEQVLLEHMKGNHKPGEMPYVCQVCNYRSSFFSDVETHFRTVHENTKDLLCPFCLKVLRTSHIYMQHYMKHQNKGIHRCGKCRLNFLTYKEKLEHWTHVHKTFRKPKALEGLPPGTKVTIRASLTGKANYLPVPGDQASSSVPLETPRSNHQSKAPYVVSKFKMNVPGGGKAKTNQAKRQQETLNSRHNLALTNLRMDGRQHTCIECSTQLDDFFHHFPMVSNCGACKYRTSCKVSISNHMIRFHSTITKNRFLKMDLKKHSLTIKFTLTCLNCDFLVNASGGDLMAKHLSDRPSHSCKVIQERDVKAKDHVPASVPVKVQEVTLAPPERPKELDMTEAESVPSENQTDQTESTPSSSAGDEEKVSTEMAVSEESPKGESKQPLESTSSMSEPTEKVSDLCTDSVNAEGPAVNEELLLPLNEPSTDEQQPKAD